MRLIYLPPNLITLLWYTEFSRPGNWYDWHFFISLLLWPTAYKASLFGGVSVQSFVYASKSSYYLFLGLPPSQVVILITRPISVWSSFPHWHIIISSSKILYLEHSNVYNLTLKWNMLSFNLDNMNNILQSALHWFIKVKVLFSESNLAKLRYKYNHYTSSWSTSLFTMVLSFTFNQVDKTIC